MSLTCTAVSGSGLAQYIDELARLRIRVFREFPYLYDGDEAYEKRYLQTYLNSPRSIMVLAREGNTVVGASSALPLADETEEVQAPFITAGYSAGDVFYCGESVLLNEYRGQGIGVEFFNQREAHARALGGFRYICFCAVDRPADHPRRPADYQPLDEFWKKRGYAKQPQLKTEFVWQDVDENTESAKPMTFWMKTL